MNKIQTDTAGHRRRPRVAG